MLVTLVQDSVFVLSTLMALCRIRAGGISLCNRALQMMIICCNKQEAVVQGPNGRDVFFSSDSQLI